MLKSEQGVFTLKTDNNAGLHPVKKTDWHPADIIAALHKKNTTLAAGSRAAGLRPSTLNNALVRPWPKGEWLIAEAIAVHPSEIWPERYYNPHTRQLIDRRSRIRVKK